MKQFGKISPFPALALVAGILCFVLRMWLFSAAIDEKGLLLNTHPANFGILILLLFGLFCLLYLTKKASLPASYQKLFPRSLPAALGCWAAAAALLYFAALHFRYTQDVVANPTAAGMHFGKLQKTTSVLHLATGIAAAGAFVLSGFCRLRQKQPGIPFHAAATVFFMTYLLSQYAGWSGDAHIYRYGYEAATGVVLMLTCYYRAALDVDIKHARTYLFFSQSAIVLCCICLAGENRFLYLAILLWLLTNTCTPSSDGLASLSRPMELPKPVLYCIRLLRSKGYQAYAVGGCVRDTVLGIPPHDYDLCTNALPAELCKVFEKQKLVRSGEKHGTIGVVFQQMICEITTFRTDGSYTDSRHPDSVRFVPSLEEDLKRRDFTVNAMAFSPTAGYVDCCGGLQDLESRCLRAVGDPDTRFREDALRILRGIRFSIRYGLTPDPQTEQAMTGLAPLMEHLARERVFEELCKLLPYATAEDLLRFSPILTQVIPELAPCLGFDQHSPHHPYDVYTHTAHVVQACPPELPLRWAALLHDIGKPATFTQDAEEKGHFYGHAAVSAEMADAILRRLKAPNALREQVVFLTEHHMMPLEPDRKLLLRKLGKYGKDNLFLLLALQKADFGSTAAAQNTAGSFSRTEELLTELLQQASCFSLKDLAVNGRDILSLGVPAGPLVGTIMQALLLQVQEETLPNTKEALMAAARELLQQP